jgi:hypothetical protein
MAGVKVTDLTALGTADPTDIMYIVDTTANQSKKIELQDIYSGMPQFESGNYTPTISGANDCTATVLRAIYSRVDNIVTMSIYFDVDLDAGFAVGSFNISPPVGSTFTSPRDAFGVITPITNPFSELISTIVAADTASNQISIVVEVSVPDAAITVVANIQYIII